MARKFVNKLMHPTCSAMDRVVNKLISLDICQVLLLQFSDTVEPTVDTNGVDFRFLSAADLDRYCQDPESDLDAQMLPSMEQQGIQCYGAFSGQELLGYCWLADENVRPEHNTGGDQYLGIGLQLAPDVSYLFKCFVLPDHRGHGINKQLIWNLSLILKQLGKEKLVTTTHWLNWAFQSSANRIGFKKIGMAAELKAIGRNYFWWSKLSACGVLFYRPGSCGDNALVGEATTAT